MVRGTRLRYRARVAYHGRHFDGFQLQPGKSRTVQGALEAALHQRLALPTTSIDERVIKVVAAGRTDAGVHARGQAVHWDVPMTINNGIDDDLAALCHSLNALLPPDVRLWNLQRVNSDSAMIRKPLPRHLQSNDEEEEAPLADFLWNVLFEARHKWYSYRISVAAVLDPLSEQHTWHCPGVNVDVLGRVLQECVGTHDFRAFSCGVERTEQATQRACNTVRTIYRIALEKEERDDVVRMDFYIQGALYKQIRNLVGTAVDVARGVVPEDTIRRLLAAPPNTGTSTTSDTTSISNRRSDNPSKPAPPHGLTLEWVHFDDF